jgi:hypothetical protein
VRQKRSKPPVRRQVFVLTPEEKRTICFVLITLVLGLATEHYRASHSASPLKTGVNETATTAAHPAQKIKRNQAAK